MDTIHIELSHFRKHLDTSVSFPTKGLIHLQGKNGQGKTTIFNAMVFALYGKAKKPHTRGVKKTARVTLDMCGLHITRTARPNRVVVTYEGAEYEGSAAEGIIQSTLGMDYNEFMVSSYIVQLEKNRVSILSMTPAEQLRVIQTLAFGGDSKNVEVKKRAKDLIRATLDEKIKLEGQLQLLNTQLCAAEEACGEEPDRPAEIDNGLDVDMVNAQISAYRDEATTLGEKLNDLNTTLETLRAEERSTKDARDATQKIKVEINTLEAKKKVLGPQKTQDELRSLEASLTEKHAELEVAKQCAEYVRSKATFDALKEDFYTDANAKLAALEGTVKTAEELEELQSLQSLLESQIADYEILRRNVETLTARKEEARAAIASTFRAIRGTYSITSKKPKEVVAFLEGHLSTAKKNLASLTAKRRTRRRYTCPECKKCVALTFKDELIKAPKEETDEVIENLETKIASTLQVSAQLSMWIEELNAELVHLNVTIPSLPDNPRDELTLRTKELIKATKIKNDYDDLLKLELPPTLNRLSVTLEENARNLPSSPARVAATLALLQSSVVRLADSIENAWRIRKEHTLIDKELTAKKKLLATSEAHAKILGKGELVTLKTCESEVTTILEQISENSRALEASYELMQSLKTYEEWSSRTASLEELRSEISLYEASLKDTSERLEGAYGLEEACKQAELLAIQKTIENINEHARGYLDDFFEEPITVRLEPGESKLGVSIEYRTDTFTDIEEELSGGERQRCELAFILGINDMVQSKILLLDECLNNIDGETGSDILELLKEYASTKPVIVISHDCVGVFDEVIEM